MPEIDFEWSCSELPFSCSDTPTLALEDVGAVPRSPRPTYEWSEEEKEADIAENTAEREFFFELPVFRETCRLAYSRIRWRPSFGAATLMLCSVYFLLFHGRPPTITFTQ